MKILCDNKLKNIIYKLPVVALFVAALILSSGITRLVMAGLLFCALVCLLLDGQIRVVALIVVVLLFIPLNVYANIKGNDDLFFYHVTNQSLYQPEFYEQQIFPDAYVRELVKDKTVIVPNEVKTYDQYVSVEEEKRDDFVISYYSDNNYVRYFSEYAGNSEIDEALPDAKMMYEEFMLDKTDFTSFGCANDLLRYSFLLNKESEKEMSYFWYSWFYYTFSETKEWYPEVYIATEGIQNADRLVALWDKKENLYLMSEDYYREKVKI